MSETPEFVAELVDAGEQDGLEWSRTLIAGALAEQVRERFGVTDGSPVYFYEDQEEDGGCSTCYSVDNRLTVECGEHRKRFYTDGALPLVKLLAWFDEPQRWAEEEAVRERKRQAQVDLFAGIGSAFSRVQVDPLSPGWHSDMLRQLGIP